MPALDRLRSLFPNRDRNVQPPRFGDVGELGERPDLPFPPVKLRRIVGPTDKQDFDNPNGDRIWGDLDVGGLEPGEAYRRVFDFGCGCGRNARQLLLQHEPPQRYVGIDIHPGLVAWCKKNLSRPGVEVHFDHHDVWSPTYAPKNSKRETLPLTPYGTDYTLVNAHSVFTHLYERQAEHYLDQCRRLIGERGLLRTTWFFFDRAWFPVLAPHQHSLFVNDFDPTQAVYFDWQYFLGLIRKLGLKIVHLNWTVVPGFQSEVFLMKGEQGDDPPEPPGTILGFGASRAPVEPG